VYMPCFVLHYMRDYPPIPQRSGTKKRVYSESSKCFITIDCLTHTNLSTLPMNNNTTITMNNLPTNLATIRARQKHNHSRNLTRLAAPANRSRESFLAFLSHGRHDQWRPHGAWCDCVDADAFADPLVAEAVCESCDGALRGSVVEQVGPADVGVDAGVVDDGVAFGHVWEGVFGEVEEC
jgi:hypothetical protein